MTDENKMTVASLLATMSKEGIGYLSVAFETDPPQITFFRNFNGDANVMAELLETLAKQLRGAKDVPQLVLPQIQ